MVVSIVTNNIGYEKLGKSISNVKVSKIFVDKDDTKGVESNEKLADNLIRCGVDPPRQE